VGLVAARGHRCRALRWLVVEPAAQTVTGASAAQSPRTA
jgi:hypothetical protein